MNDDELTGIFDNLTPEDFVRKTTARIETHLPGSPNQGPEAFAQFVNHNIDVVRSSSLASGGKEINPVAVLANADTQWIFAPTEEENMGEYIARLHEEAVQLEATWVFISRQTLVSSAPATDLPDVTDKQAVEKAIAENKLKQGVIFYAQRIEGGQCEHRHGTMFIEEGGLTPPVYGDPTQKVSYFARILEGMETAG